MPAPQIMAPSAKESGESVESVESGSLAATGSARAAPRLIVTTAKNARAGLWERAELVAARCQAPLLSRDGLLDEKLQAAGATHIYRVGHLREELRDREGHELYLHLGMMRQRRLAGANHPLLRAVQPPGVRPVRRVLDVTLGLAGDAHHLAFSLSADVIGVETSPVLFSLLEEGIDRIARMPRPVAQAIRRVHVVHAEAESFLASQADGSADVVYLDPMMPWPLKSQAGFDLLRAFACHTPPSVTLLEQAARVASCRVVMKLPRGAPEPAGPLSWTAFSTRKLTYIRYEKETALGSDAHRRGEAP